MLHLVLGRAGVGKTHFINRSIYHSLKEGDDRARILIVPEQYTLEAERELMDVLHEKVLLKIEVLSFQRLAYRFLSQGRFLDERGRIMILRHCIKRRERPFRIYEKMRGKEGFLKECNRLIVELLQSHITPRELQKITGDPSLEDKLEDISSIYEDYLDYISPLYTDREEGFHLLAQRIPLESSLKGALVWMYGFKGFTGQEYRVIESLFAVVSTLTMALTIGEEDIFEPTKKTYSTMKELATPHLQIEETYLNKSLISSPSINHLEENLFTYPLTPYQYGVEDICIIPGLHPQEEVELVAEEILNLVREKGYRFKEMVVVTNVLEEYGPLIRRIFPLYGIPFFLDEKRSMVDNPVIISILSALRVVLGTFQYQDLFTFLKTGFGPLNRDEVEELENYVLEWGIKGEEYSLSFTRSTRENQRERVEELRSTLMEIFLPFYKRCRERGTPSYYTEKLEEFLERLKLKERVEDWIEELRERGLDTDTYVHEISQTFEALEEVLKMIQDLLEEEIDFHEYVTILETALSQSKVGVIPPTLDQVLIGDLERSRSHTTRALFVIGVNDGMLPSPLMSRGLLLDDERTYLQKRGLSFVDGFTLTREERFNIYSLFSKTEEFFMMTYALTDRGGHPLQPSLLIKQIEELFPLMRKDRERVYPVSSPQATFQHLIPQLQLYKKRGQFKEMSRGLFHWYYKKKEWRERLNPLLDTLFDPSREEYLTEEQAQLLFGPPLSLSLSQLETFLQCPFAHYIESVLRPEKREIYKITPLEIGSLIHQALETFTAKLQNHGLDWRELEKERGEEMIEGIIDAHCKDYREGLFYHEAFNTYYVQVLKDLGKRTVNTIREQLQRGEYRVAYPEILFSKKGHLPPLEIPLLSGGVMELEGRIDRLDTWEREETLYVRIIDYKTGRRTFSLGEAYAGLQIQLPLYLLAVMKGGHILFQRHIEPGGFFYYHIHDPILDGDRLGDEVIEEEILRELRLHGLLIGQEEDLLSHDRTIEEGQSSFVVPLKRNKGGEISRTSNVMEEKEVHLFLAHIRNSLGRRGEELVKGQIAVRPVRVNRDRKSIPCHYCDYPSICAFYPYEDRYRDVEKKRKEEIIEELRRDGGCNTQKNRGS